MQESKISKMRECAMRDGTYLGPLWILTFSTSILMFKSMSNSYGLIAWAVTIALMLLSPVLVYKFARSYRDKECNGTIPYSVAWLYMLIVYACAILLSSIAQYIFYAYIDPHLFATTMAQMESFAAANNIDAESIRVLSEALEELSRMSAGEIVISQIGGHLSRDILISAILALAIKKN